MKKFKINNLLEYLSLTFIISYFSFHNILLVFIGIISSFFLINIDLIKKRIGYGRKNYETTKEAKEVNKNDMERKSNSMIIKSTKKDSNLTLAQTIEVLGFIPSIDRKNDIN